MSAAKIHTRKLHFPLTLVLIILLAIIAILGPAATIYIYNKYRPINTKVIMGAVSAPPHDEVGVLNNKIREYMDLPPEMPTIATVSDLEKLKSQPFFARARQGDKVLFFQSVKKAILFRPAINKIIDVATMNIGSAPSTKANVSVTPTITQAARNDKDLKVVVWNGTTTAGIAQKGENVLKNVANVTVTIAEEGAQKRDYEKTLVINLNEVPEEKIKEIAGLVGARVEKIPNFEKAPPYDVLIILGRDYIN